MERWRVRSSASRRNRAMCLAVLVPGLMVALVAAATAQTRKPGTAPAARAAQGRKAPAADSGAGTGHVSAAPVAAAVSQGSSSIDAGVVESRTLDGGTRVFKFSELDIEGRLKSPQLVYFLRRVRAEFAAEELGHRTFMREMSETRKESSF